MVNIFHLFTYITVPQYIILFGDSKIMRKIGFILGAKANYIKAASLHFALKKRDQFSIVLFATPRSAVIGQFLGFPAPDHFLATTKRGIHRQAADLINQIADELQELDILLIFGDCSMSFAAAISGATLGVNIAYIGANTSEFDRNVPEEINRTMISSIANYRFVQEPVPISVNNNYTFFVGNTTADTLLAVRLRGKELDVAKHYGLQHRKYIVVTLHQPKNVEEEANLAIIMDALYDLSTAYNLQVFFPMHTETLQKFSKLKIPPSKKKVNSGGVPKSHARMKQIDPNETFPEYVKENPNFIITELLGYWHFVNLIDHAGLVITDSMSLQEETTILKIPCLTLSDKTKHPITIKQGTNCLLQKITKERIIGKVLDAFNNKWDIPDNDIEFWDGFAGERIAKLLERIY